MMRQMRENTKWIMLITALAFVGLMVFQWGMDLSGRSSMPAGGELGSVNGEPITAEEYNLAYQNLYQQQQARMGGEPITQAMNRQIQDAAWEQLITNKILEQELRRRGIRVTDSEILDAAKYSPPPEVAQNPAFQTDGQFDLQKYQQFLGSNLDDQTLSSLEAYYREVIPRSKLYFQTTAGVSVSDGQLWRMYRDANEQVQVRFVSFDPAAIVPESEVRVTDAAIRSFYDEHQDDFIRPARATVKYLVMDRSATAADSAAALQRAQQYRARLAGGASFPAVATEAGVDTLAPSQRLSLTVTRGGQQFPPAFEQAAFSTPVGELSEPILTQYGYHLIRPKTRAGDTAEVEHLLVEVTLSPEREDQLFERADSLETLAEDRSLEQVGQAMNLPVSTVEITPPLVFIPGVGTADDGVAWALEDAEPGDLSELFEAPGSYYMLELVSRTDEGPLSLEAATPSIRTILVRQQQVEQAKQRLRDAAAAARRGQPLEQVAGSWNRTVETAGPFSRGESVPGLGQFNAAIGTAFGLEQGQVSELVEANGQLYLVQLVQRTEASRTEWQKQVAEQRARVLQSLADEKWQQYLGSLREQSEVVDRRREQARAAAAQQQQAGFQ